MVKFQQATIIFKIDGIGFIKAIHNNPLKSKAINTQNSSKS